MELQMSLRVGLHIEHPTRLTIVQAMLTLAGHQCLPDMHEGYSLSLYIKTIIENLQVISSSGYDLLILGCTNPAALTDPETAIALEHLIVLTQLPIIVLFNTTSDDIGHFQERFPTVVFLSHSPLWMQGFFEVIDRLTHTPPKGPTGFMQHFSQAQQEQLRQQDQKHIAQRQLWLDQRQEWLDQKKAWLEDRQAWIQTRQKAPDSQREWLAEQRAWLEQQWQEVDSQQQKLFDLRRWLNAARAGSQHDGL
jgi:hypothetical protein